VVQAKTGLADGVLIINEATVSSSTEDPDSTNNTDDALTQIFGEADVEITKTSVNGTVIAGENADFTIQVHNEGPSTATVVEVKELVPDGLTLESFTSNDGFCTSEVSQCYDCIVI